MTNTFNLKIITPEKTIFADEINMAMIPSYEGDMSILKDHISIITFLRPGIIKTNNSKESSESFFVTDGIVEFSENNLVILSTSAINAKELKKLAEAQITNVTLFDNVSNLQIKINTTNTLY